jgi:hypothetical protein
LTSRRQLESVKLWGPGVIISLLRKLKAIT